jgi:transcriptional regulator with XRE-family HTH domain
MPAKRPPEGHILRALGRLIAARRKARGLTQCDLAMLTGMPEQTLYYYESGRYWVPLDKLIRIANQCDMPLSMFVSPLDDFHIPPAKIPPGDDGDDDPDA